MTSALRACGLGAALLLLSAPAAAQERSGMVLWDQQLASAMHEMVERDGICRDNPYRADSWACQEPGLHILLNRDYRAEQTWLDRVVVFVDESRRVEADRRFDERRKLKFDAELQTLTPSEAELHLTFKLEF